LHDPQSVLHDDVSHGLHDDVSHGLHPVTDIVEQDEDVVVGQVVGQGSQSLLLPLAHSTLPPTPKYGVHPHSFSHHV